MDKHKNHLVSYLQSTLLVFVILCVSSVEAIYLGVYSLIAVVLVLLIQAAFSRIYLSKNEESQYPLLLWVFCACLIPFSKFYSDYSSDTYFLIMNCIAGVAVGRLLACFCRGLADSFESLDEQNLVGESIIFARALELLPMAFVVILFYLLMSLQNGINGLVLVGDLTLVSKFPIIMLIGSVFPMILIMKALTIIHKRERSND
ncbi:hypothetical protein LNTAR_13922 [Lentisphaera araneosa HTCC2155]|uniref:Uncharacterized protein n=1 Tax=Lentisphaera araneosa HTCC2155 TaxID=313628 RepID=A6DH36_9BACT|nr:hypothetical protein [Lentisphaera araneosa]EDM28919.1 hypothetical protein LNTAR_13922 [Lentisphaera araneosa HTCC2155]